MFGWFQLHDCWAHMTDILYNGGFKRRDLKSAVAQKRQGWDRQWWTQRGKTCVSEFEGNTWCHITWRCVQVLPVLNGEGQRMFGCFPLSDAFPSPSPSSLFSSLPPLRFDFCLSALSIPSPASTSSPPLLFLLRPLCQCLCLSAVFFIFFSTNSLSQLWRFSISLCLCLCHDLSEGGLYPVLGWIGVRWWAVGHHVRLKITAYMPQNAPDSVLTVWISSFDLILCDSSCSLSLLEQSAHAGDLMMKKVML